ncbi:MAG: hypothetical protein Q8M76_00225, partial [Spirochaetaceae bacterium]|nr:hypothetical protein [Spirochaetaceae bacterium]
MSKKIWALVLTLLLAGTFAWADIELGAGISPPLGELPEGMPEEAAGPLGNTMVSFHGGYSFAWLFYVSADAFVLPPFVVRNMTSYVDEQGFVKDGQFRPGFLNLINVGIRPKIGPFAVSATVGINNLYLYKSSEIAEDAYSPELGVNLRLGAYFFLSKSLAVTVSGTTVFPDSNALVSTLKAVAD